MWANLGIRQKTLLVFMIAALVPLVAINLLWLRTLQDQIKQSAATQQQLLVTSAASRVSEFLDAKLNLAISHSQAQSVVEMNLDEARINLLQYASLDANAVRIALVDPQGNEKLVVQNHELSTDLKNVRDSESFGVVRLLSNEATTSNVFFVGNDPRITLAVPLLSYSRLGDQHLSSSQALARRGGADTKGALIVEISLADLWQSVLPKTLGDSGFAYVINEQGSIIAHPNQDLLKTQAPLSPTTEPGHAVITLGSLDDASRDKQFVPTAQITTSASGQEVLSSHHPIGRTKWAVIGEEPVTSMYKRVDRARRMAAAMLTGSVVLATILVLLATRSIIMPIRQLTRGAVRLGEGHFSEKLAFKGRDELATLAHTFNNMGQSIQQLLDQYREQNAGLRAEQAKLQAVLDTIADGVIVLDKEFKIALANKTALTIIQQTSDQAIKGKAWLEALPLRHKGKPIGNSSLGDEATVIEDVVLDLIDQRKYLNLIVVRLKNDPSGMAYILTIHDTTESRELENMRLDFVSMAAHELRTPLTAITGYLSLVGTKNPEKNEEYIERAKANAMSLSYLINNLLALSHIERNALQFNMLRLHWVDLVRSQVSNQHFAARAKNIELISHLPEQELFVQGDKLALEEVLGNILSNAIHYTNEGGTITVTVEAQAGNKIKTTVSDTGIGIPKEALGKLFTKYYRVDGGLTTNSQGTGIGLFISHAIIEGHHGTINVESELGKGSSFSIILDAAPSTDTRQNEEHSATMPQRSKVAWFN